MQNSLLFSHQMHLPKSSFVFHFHFRLHLSLASFSHLLHHPFIVGTQFLHLNVVLVVLHTKFHPTQNVCVCVLLVLRTSNNCLFVFFILCLFVARLVRFIALPIIIIIKPTSSIQPWMRLGHRVSKQMPSMSSPMPFIINERKERTGFVRCCLVA